MNKFDLSKLLLRRGVRVLGGVILVVMGLVLIFMSDEVVKRAVDWVGSQVPVEDNYQAEDTPRGNEPKL